MDVSKPQLPFPQLRSVPARFSAVTSASSHVPTPTTTPSSFSAIPTAGSPLPLGPYAELLCAGAAFYPPSSSLSPSSQYSPSPSPSSSPSPSPTSTTHGSNPDSSRLDPSTWPSPPSRSPTVHSATVAATVSPFFSLTPYPPPSTSGPPPASLSVSASSAPPFGSFGLSAALPPASSASLRWTPVAASAVASTLPSPTLATAAFSTAQLTLSPSSFPLPSSAGTITPVRSPNFAPFVPSFSSVSSSASASLTTRPVSVSGSVSSSSDLHSLLVRVPTPPSVIDIHIPFLSGPSDSDLTAAPIAPASNATSSSSFHDVVGKPPLSSAVTVLCDGPASPAPRLDDGPALLAPVPASVRSRPPALHDVAHDNSSSPPSSSLAKGGAPVIIGLSPRSVASSLSLREYSYPVSGAAGTMSVSSTATTATFPLPTSPVAISSAAPPPAFPTAVTMTPTVASPTFLLPLQRHIPLPHTNFVDQHCLLPSLALPGPGSPRSVPSSVSLHSFTCHTPASASTPAGTVPPAALASNGVTDDESVAGDAGASVLSSLTEPSSALAYAATACPTAPTQLLVDYSVADVSAWMHRHDMGSYAAKFRDNLVNGRLLVTLTDADLVELGIGNKFHRKRLIVELKHEISNIK